MAIVIAVGLASTVVGTALAGPMITFTYTNLAGQYKYDGPGPDTGSFRAVAAASNDLQTDGSVSLVPGLGAGTAVFNPGFVSRTIADFQIDISFFNRVGNMASGNGTFVAKDVFGNTLSGQLAGDWVMFGGAVFFNGAIRGAVFTPILTALLPFTGESNTSFGMAGPIAVQPLDGSIVQIFLATPPNSNMDQDFREVSTGVAGQLIPTPASAALMALGGLVAARRRRN
jgi:hypothetical protein